MISRLEGLILASPNRSYPDSQFASSFIGLTTENEDGSKFIKDIGVL